MHDAIIWASILFDENDLIEIRPLQPWQGKREWILAKELPRHLDRMSFENDRGANLFIGVMPRNERGGGSAEHVDYGHAIWADFDNCDPQAAVDIIKKMGIPDPTMVTATGHGAHVFWRLDQPHPKADIVDLVGRFVARFLADSNAAKHVDKSAKDAARILRVPGFINKKPPVARASILFADKSRRYTIEELREHAPSEAERQQRKEAKEEAKQQNKRIEIDTEGGAKKAASYASKMEGSSKGGRTTKIFHLACVLVADFALDDQTALQIMRDWDLQANTPPVQGDPIYPDNELEKILANAHKYHKGAIGSKVKQDDSDSNNGVVDGIDISAILCMRRREQLDLPTMPDTYLDVPGFIGDVVRYNLATAPKPQPVLALAGAIALQAVLCARKITSEFSAMPNMYICCVADSGTGKEHARHVMKSILQKIDALDLQSEGIKSGAALASKLQRNPATIFQLDEFGLILQNISMSKSTPHLHDIVTKMLSLYSSSRDVWKMSDAAKEEDGGDIIYFPHAIVYGTTVPGELYNGLSIESVTNGFVGRMMVFDTRGNDPIRTMRSTVEIPHHIIDCARAWYEYGGEGNLSGIVPNPKLRVVPVSQAAKKIMGDFCIKEHEERKAMIGDVRGALWTRTAENADKLALVYAASKYCQKIDEIEIDEDAARWGYGLSEFLTRNMIESIGDNIAENSFHGDLLKLQRYLRKGMKDHPEGMPRTQLYRQMKMKKRHLDEVLETAAQSGYILETKTLPGDQGGATLRTYKWIGP